MKTEDACISSHLKAIHTAYHQNDQYALIAEDDSIIKNINWNKLINSAPKDWEILQMHVCCLSATSGNQLQQHLKDENTLWIHTQDIIPSMAFYIINRDGMYKLLKQFVIGYQNPNWNDIVELDFTSARVNCQADLLLFDIINRYVCAYPFVDIYDTDSTISWTHTKYNNYNCYRLTNQ
jgi:hypothetical protein